METYLERLMVHNKVNDTSHFMKRIIVLVRDHKMDYLDAIMKYCEETGIEVEYAATLVKRCGPIMQMLEAEMVDNRVISSGKDKPVSLTTFMVDD
jgi:hypothetical protein